MTVTSDQLSLLGDPPPVQLPAFRRIRLVIAYLGTNFRGLAVQPKLRTVGGELGRAVQIVFSLPELPTFGMSGRTDAGVHSQGQVLHFDVPATSKVDLARAKKSLNTMLKPEITVRSIEVAPIGFDARYSALWRRYRYTLLSGVDTDPFLASTAWRIPETLDLAAMRLACDPILGSHDFSSFCRVPKDKDEPSMTREVTEAIWIDKRAEHEGMLWFEIQANAFCQQMVRALVGLMRDVGRHHKTAGDVLAIIRAKDRNQASPIAPAHGLCLIEVGYPNLGCS